MKSVLKIASKLWSTPPEEVWAKLKIRAGFTNITQFDRHIWCLSTGRVGTNTLAALGELMPSVYSVHEPQPLLFGLGKTAYESTSESSDLAIVAGIETCRRQLSGLNQTTYLETSPHVTFVARQLKQVFPNSKFIHVVRHPVDVVRSGMRRKWYGGNPTDQWRIKPAEGSNVFSQWSRFDPLAKNIWSWAETNRWIVEFLKEIPFEDQLLVTSESLFSGEELFLKKLFDFCGSPVASKARIQRVLGMKLNFQNSGNFPSVDDWSLDQRKQLMQLAGDMMDRLNYRIEDPSQVATS